MRSILAAAALLAFAGCATSLPDLAGENQANLVRLSPGMTKNQVVWIMGTTKAETRNGPVANPFKIDNFQDKGGSQYEVLYYVTQRNRRGHPVSVADATPLVLKDGVLIGWGPQTLSKARNASY